MEPLCASHSNENSLTVERESFQSTSAPTSPTKIPITVMSMNMIAISQNASGDSSAESTASADNLHSRSTFGTDLTNRHKSHRSVKFPEDNAIVTGYHYPDPYRYVTEMVDNDVESVSIAYKEACAKQNIVPIPSVLEQIQNFKCNRMRAQDLILRGEQLDAHQCEALEEILKRVLFRLIDLDSCNLDCDGASALFDMIEFYESASHLSIANNTTIGVMGWQSLCRTLKKTACLQYLDLSNTGLNEQILLIMGRTIRVGSHLVTLHLENAGLFSRRLAILVSSIKFNTSLRELYLGENKICSADCVQLGNLLRGNGFLNVLDLRSNFIQDIGLDHICEGLAHQPSSSSLFDIFGHENKHPVSQNSGILILNLSDNQLSSRAMSRLAQTLSQCRSLIGLDLSNNALGDDGVIILKEGLQQCKTLKYLNLSNTSITSEGSNAIADVISHSSSLSIIDLSNNDITHDGFVAICQALKSKVGGVTKLVLCPQSSYPPSDGSKPNADTEELLEEVDALCDRNKSEAKFDEFDEILSGHLRSDISVYSEIEMNNVNAFNDSNNNFNYSNDDSSSPFYCDNSEGGPTEETEEENQVGPGASKKPVLMRTASLGSWERPVKSGRFSVSPVDLNCEDGSLSGPEIQINVDMITGGDARPEDCIAVTVSGTDSVETRSYSSDEDNASDLSQNETDCLCELPSKQDLFGSMGMSRLAPPQRSFRRMSSPAIPAGLVKAPKPKPNLQLKLSGNLESLDLKSSLPLSPTFFAKFDFSDLSLLRLPADVEEIISNLSIHNSDSEELIFQFEQDFRSSNKAQSSRPQHSFDATKSTKGASKLRRDLINSEIANLRDLLPLPSSTRQRLSQLQLMALVCVYVRKANYFQHAFRKHELMPHLPVTNFGFSKALSGFLMMMTQNGKLLYISDNAAEYLGHSMEDLLIHGDSVYDIIEKQDHQTIQNELVRASNPLNVSNDSRIFLCRMNVSRNSRRQMRFGDQKVVLVQGHFVSYLPLCSRNEPVFLATCTPVAMPETRECVVQGSTNVFTSIHSMDMKFIHLDANGEFHLGYNKNQLKNLSWYDIVHWENLSDAQSKHRLITQSEQERSCILLLRLQTSSTTWIWVHVVLQVKDNNENSQQPVIVCTNQVLSDKEAAVMQANSWLYQFYSLHSKLHYTMQNSNVSGSQSATSTPVPSHSPTSPNSYEAATPSITTTCSSTRASFTSPASYTASSAFSGQQNAHHAYHSIPTAGSEAPSLALHPSHPNMSYYHGQSSATTGMGVSVSTSPSSHQYAGHFGAHSSPQQYSPQAGTLPYQAMPNQTGSSGSTSASTPPATSQTEVRIKEEPSATTTSRASKRTRSSSGHQEEEEGGKLRTAKSHKKNSNSQSEQSSNNGNGITAGTGSTAGGPYSSSSYGSSSSAASQHSGYHSAYHPTGSVFGSTGFTSSELSSMMPAYYGNSMSYHHHHHHHHHPHHAHSQLAYPHHHFQGKFPFFEHGAAGSSSSLTGGSSTSFDHRQPSTHTNRSADRGCSEESATVLSSAHFGNSSLHQLNSKQKGTLLYHAAADSLADRRELDKVRSPESITSATSDYGSMSSQSPPSTFEKPFPSLPPLAESLDYSRAHYSNSLKANWSAYHHPHHHQPSAAAVAAAASASAEKPSEERSNLPFSSLSFQFWPGYSSTTAELSSYDAQHRHAHLPPTASTFPVDSLLHSHSGHTAAVYGAAGNLFAAYGESGNPYEAESKSALVNRSSSISSSSFRAHSSKAESKMSSSAAASSTVKPASQAPAPSAIAVTRAL